MQKSDTLSYGDVAAAVSGVFIHLAFPLTLTLPRTPFVSLWLPPPSRREAFNVLDLHASRRASLPMSPATEFPYRL